MIVLCQQHQQHQYELRQIEKCWRQIVMHMEITIHLTRALFEWIRAATTTMATATAKCAANWRKWDRQISHCVATNEKGKRQFIWAWERTRRYTVETKWNGIHRFNTDIKLYTHSNTTTNAGDNAQLLWLAHATHQRRRQKKGGENTLTISRCVK